MRRSWDAASYHRVSSAMDAMNLEVLDRLPLRGDETVLDAGCGTGRITARLLERLPEGRVIAVDADPRMVAVARENLPRTTVILSDLLDLRLPSSVDAAFSTATFHWVLDHERLFGRLAHALRPGGSLVAQCGGEGNIVDLNEAAEAVAASPRWRDAFASFERNWNFAGVDETRSRLTRAGFTDIDCWLQPFPIHSDEPLEYLETVPLGSWVQILPAENRREFVSEVWHRLGGDGSIDYVRLNITARRA